MAKKTRKKFTEEEKRQAVNDYVSGTKRLTDKKILQIIGAYGFTMEYFNRLLKVVPLRHELIEDGQKILESMDENKLRVILPMLQSMK